MLMTGEIEALGEKYPSATCPSQILHDTTRNWTPAPHGEGLAANRLGHGLA